METISARFIRLFHNLDPKFGALIQWSDETGISFYEDHEDGYASLYKIGIGKRTNEDLEDIEKLHVTVSYGKKIDDSISLVAEKDNFSDPISLNFANEFSFNTETNEFYFEDSVITAQQLVEKVERAHKLPTRPLLGLFTRFELIFWRKFIPLMIFGMDKIISSFLWLVSGEKTKDNLLTRGWVEKPEENNRGEVSFVKTKTMNFFGYEAKRWSVVFYCATQLLFYFLLLNKLIGITVVTRMFKNAFLALCYAVVTFAFTEYLVPLILKEMLKLSSKLYTRTAFKSIKIRT